MNSSANGTVIDEKPYPRPPLTMAANSVMTIRERTWVDVAPLYKVG